MVTPAAAAASDLGATVSSSAPAAAPAATIGDDVIGDLTSSHGLTVSEVDRVDERLVRLTVASQELARPVRLTLLLPQGYTATTRRYPTLYLLHGTSGGADDWVQQGEAEDITAGFPMIVVMPDGGYDSNGGGWWTDWVDQDTALGVANWETFHIEQLVPWVDAHLRTRARRSQRAIAGLSQGGFGAMSYASRHPDLFVSAASFSGAPDIAKAPQARTLGAAVVGAIMTGLNGVQPHAPFGDPVLDAVNWQGHNPADLVGNLRGMDLRLWVGDGTNGPYEDTADPRYASPDPIEAIVHESTLLFAEAADAAGVPYVLDDYGPGRHRWPYWARDLAQYLPRLAEVFRQDRSVPERIDYRSIDRRYSTWGWRVRTRREPPQAFSGLVRASREGFVFLAGPAVVRTPPSYRPLTTYRLRVQGERTRARSDARGRLRVAVSGGRSVVRVQGRLPG